MGKRKYKHHSMDIKQKELYEMLPDAKCDYSDIAVDAHIIESIMGDIRKLYIDGFTKDSISRIIADVALAVSKRSDIEHASKKQLIECIVMDIIGSLDIDGAEKELLTRAFKYLFHDIISDFLVIYKRQGISYYWA